MRNGITFDSTRVDHAATRKIDLAVFRYSEYSSINSGITARDSENLLLRFIGAREAIVFKKKGGKRKSASKQNDTFLPHRYHCARDDSDSIK
jgi:hypothetical protein